MNQRQLECFFAVAKELHFRKAAESLHLGQGTVSDSITALERSLGGRLFVRSSRNVQLTTLGHELLAATLGPYERLEAAFDSVMDTTRRRSGLVFAHTPELGQLFVPRLIAAQTRGLAGVDRPVDSWTLNRLHTHEQLAALKSRTLDLGLCWSPRPEKGVAVTEVAVLPYVAVLKADDPLAARSAVGLEDLAGRRLLTTPKAHNQLLSMQVETALRAAGVGVQVLEEFPHFAELSFRVATSQAVVGIHPASIVLLNNTSGLVFRRIRDPDLTAAIAVMAPPRPGAMTIALMDLIHEVTREIVAEVDRLLPVG